jgi:drug/metabolite transporter (DMT)-like permease
VFTAVAGFFLFNEIPGGWTLAGAGVVVAATLFITLREQQLARSAKLSAAADAQ